MPQNKKAIKLQGIIAADYAHLEKTLAAMFKPVEKDPRRIAELVMCVGVWAKNPTTPNPPVFTQTFSKYPDAFPRALVYARTFLKRHRVRQGLEFMHRAGVRLSNGKSKSFAAASDKEVAQSFEQFGFGEVSERAIGQLRKRMAAKGTK
jgi:hypothetical protein